MANDAALGRAVLELATDDTKLSAGLADAKAQTGGLDKAFGGAGAQASRFGDRVDKLGSQLSLAGKASSLLSSTFGQFTLAGIASNAIGKLTGEVSQFIATGLKLPAVEQSFGRLSSAMGINGQAMLANMSTATRGMVANYDLMTSANKAMLLGLPVTAASMGDLAKTATILGKAMGQDATKSLDDLITALGRSSPMILDNLGLTVKVGEANEAYAAKLGKTVESLTEAEKKMAFYEAAMEAARRKTAELGEQTRTLGDIATSVWTQIGNVISTMAGKINVGVGAILSSTKNLIQYFKDVAIYGNPWDAIQAAAIRASHVYRGDINLAVEKVTTTIKTSTTATKAHKEALAEVAQISPEVQRALDLLAGAHQHEAAATKFAEASWHAWENTVSKALQNVGKLATPLKLIGRDLSGIVPQVGSAAATGGNLAGSPLLPVTSALAASMGAALQQLPQMLIAALTGGGGLKGAMSGMGSLLGSTLGKSIGAGIKALGKFGGPIGEAIGALAGPLMEKIFGMFGSAGRDAVKDFVGGFGGFDAFHAMLAEKLPADAERLWIALTQGVGKNNPAEAKRVIDEITAALEAEKTKTAEAAEATADAAAVQQEALDAIAAKYAESFAAIDTEYKKLNDSVAAEAEEAEMGAQERLDRARMEELEKQRAALEAQQAAEVASKKETFGEVLAAGIDVNERLRGVFGEPLKIPYEFVGLNGPAIPMAGGGSGRVTRPTLFYSGGNEDYAFSGEGRSFGLGALAQRAIVIDHTTMLDGRVVARNQIRHTPKALAGVGVRSR